MMMQLCCVCFFCAALCALNSYVLPANLGVSVCYSDACHRLPYATIEITVILAGMLVGRPDYR